MFNEAKYTSLWFLGPPRNQPIIMVRYARRFSYGKCILAALIPAGTLTLGTIRHVGVMHEGHYYPPIIMNGPWGLYLRLMYRLPDVSPDECRYVLDCARALAIGVREYFEMPVIISPIGGLIESLQRLDAF